MTLDYSWQERADQDNTMPVQGETPEHPVHVKVTDTQSQRVAPEYTAWQTMSVVQAGTGVATQICPHRYHRYKAKMMWTIPASTVVYLDNKPDALSGPTPPPSVAQLTGPITAWMPDYDGQQALYAVYTGTGPVAVTVMDESYGTVQ